MDIFTLSIPQTTMLSNVLEFLLLLLMLGGILWYIRINSKKPEYNGLRFYLTIGFFSTIHFLGGLTTCVEVVGLAIVSVQTSTMTLFNAVTRYFIAGLIEFMVNFVFLNQVFDELTEASKDGEVTWSEKLLVMVKNFPLMVIGVIPTIIIGIMYLESTGSVVMSTTGYISLFQFWKSVSVSGLNSLTYSNAVNPQIGAFMLIFCTPFFNVFSAIFIMIKPSRKIVQMVNHHNNDNNRSEKKNQETKSKQYKRPKSSETNDSSIKDDSSKEDNHSTKNKSDFKLVDEETLNRYIKIFAKSWRNSLHETNDEYVDGDYIEDNFKKEILMFLGIDPDNLNQARSFPTTKSTIKRFITSEGDQGIDPVEYYEQNIKPIFNKRNALSPNIVNGYKDMLELCKEIEHLDSLHNNLDSGDNPVSDDDRKELTKLRNKITNSCDLIVNEFNSLKLPFKFKK
jgi:hypothetical protein